MGILSIDKRVLKESIYLIEQDKTWLVWHGTLDELKKSFLSDLKILEYSKIKEFN